MKRFWLIFALLLSVGVNLGMISAVALNGLRPPRPLLPPTLGIEQMAEVLGLTGEARRAFVERHRTFWDLREDAREEIQVLRRSMREELLSDAPDLARVEESIRRASERNLEQELAFARLVAATRSSLDADQRRRYQSLMPQIRGLEPPRARRPRDRAMIDSPPQSDGR